MSQYNGVKSGIPRPVLKTSLPKPSNRFRPNPAPATCSDTTVDTTIRLNTANEVKTMPCQVSEVKRSEIGKSNNLDDGKNRSNGDPPLVESGERKTETVSVVNVPGRSVRAAANDTNRNPDKTFVVGGGQHTRVIVPTKSSRRSSCGRRLSKPVYSVKPTALHKLPSKKQVSIKVDQMQQLKNDLASAQITIQKLEEEKCSYILNSDTIKDEKSKLLAEVETCHDYIDNLKSSLENCGFDSVLLEKMMTDDGLISEKRKKIATEAVLLKELLESHDVQALDVTAKMEKIIRADDGAISFA